MAKNWKTESSFKFKLSLFSLKFDGRCIKYLIGIEIIQLTIHFSVVHIEINHLIATQERKIIKLRVSALE